jgi:hypothetical protein
MRAGTSAKAFDVHDHGSCCRPRRKCAAPHMSNATQPSGKKAAMLSAAILMSSCMASSRILLFTIRSGCAELAPVPLSFGTLG